MADVSDFMIDPEEDGVSLYEAILQGNLPKIIELISDDPTGLNKPLGTFGVTPLRCAASTGNADCVIQLLKLGAYVDVVDIKAQTPLFVAVHNNHTEVCKLLLEAGANPNGDERNLSSPIQIACQNGFSAGLKLLLDYGAAIEGYPIHPVHIAASHEHLECYFLLLLYGAKTDLIRYSPHHSSLVDTFINKRLSPIYFFLWVLFGGKINENEKSKMMDIDEYKYLSEFIASPLTLKNLSRIKVRKCIKCFQRRDVAHLELPETLTQFLLYKDVPAFMNCN